MSVYLNIPEETLNARKGYWTAREIAQQPKVWTETAALIENQQADISAWLDPILKTDGLRIILTGAGTSAYAGEALAPHLKKSLPQQVEAISTTEIVGAPDCYLQKNVPTLLISFARSGNSPESVAACELADQLVDNCYHLIITCNKDSALSKYLGDGKNGYCLLLPEATLDQSFAMTSSFTSMVLATLFVLAPDQNQFEKAVELTSLLLKTELDQIQEQANTNFERIVFLGCGSLLGIATEAKLKTLELSAGKIDCYAESPLGFRHGPKFTISQDTMVVILNSENSYSRKYDNDLVNELIRDRQTAHVYCLNDLSLFNDTGLSDMWLALPYVVYCQALAFYKSLALGITPDNPSPSGEVNRVVQGVTIYPYEA